MGPASGSDQIRRQDHGHARADIVLWPGQDDDAFDVQALFTPGASGNGINPLTENVTLTLGPVSWEIPAGSFQQRHNWMVFDGWVDSTWIAATFRPLTGGRYTFAAVGARANLAAVKNPAPLRLRIGNDAGSVDVFARIIRQ